MELILIRHSQTKGNLQRRYIGVTDEPLCPEGIRLAEERAGSFPDADIVYISPLLRCRQTAEIIYPHVPKKVIEGLRETNFGAFENKSYKDLKDDVHYQSWLDSGGRLGFPGGEDMEEACSRVLTAFDMLLDDLKKNDVSRAAAVVHGGTIMAIMSRRALPDRDFYDWQVKNCEGYLLSVKDDFRLLELLGEYRINH